MKPFNLEEALKNPNRVVTRDGRNVTQLHRFECSDYHRLVLVLDGNIETYDTDGICGLKGIENEKDLFLLPETKTVWVVSHLLYDGSVRASVFSNKEYADKFYKGLANSVKKSKPTKIEIEI